MTYGIFHLSNIWLIIIGVAANGFLILSMWQPFIRLVRKWAFATWSIAALLIIVFSISLWTHDPNSNPPAYVLMTAMFVWLYIWGLCEVRQELRLLDSVTPAEDGLPR